MVMPLASRQTPEGKGKARNTWVRASSYDSQYED